MTVQDNINRILWDRRPVVFPQDMEVPEGIDYVIIRDLSLEDRNHYLVIRDLEERKARLEGVPTEGELLDAARQAQYWTQVEDDIESKADDHIAFLKADFDAKKKFRSRQNIIKLQIEDAEAKKAWVQRKRNEFRVNSCEYLAHEIAALQLLRRVVLHPDSSPVFPTEKSLMDAKRDYFQWTYFLLNEVMNEGSLEITTLREIARSTEWRLIWTLSRENLPAIFDRPVGGLTLNQRLLIYWSRVYDSAFESPEPPDKEVIEDNDMFDQWLANRDLNHKEEKTGGKLNEHQEQGHLLDGEYIETCTCGAKALNKGKYLGEKTLHDASCLYGTWHRYTPAEREAKARRVYGRNAKGIRKLIDQEQNNVLERGLVQEQDLRDKKTRGLLGMKNNVIPIRRR